MMLDDLHMPGDGAPEPGFPPLRAPASDGATPTAGDAIPAGDREVPLPGHLSPSILHQWLDGDVATGVVRASTGGDDAVDLWTRINDEAEILRSRTTPLYVHKRIMDSLPEDRFRMQQPWYRRPVVLRPLALLAAAAVLVALGALVARALIQ